MRHDAIVVGGSFAGLAAATYLARGRRSVCVLDTATPRNRFASASHGFLGHDGQAPGDILATAREQVLAYPTASLINAAAVDASAHAGGFTVTLADGQALEASRLVLAFGISDALPDVPGLRQRWGKTVLHCPYCHGLEFSDRPLGVLHGSPHSAMQAQLIAQWGPTTYFLNGAPLPDEATLALLDAHGVTLETTPVVEVLGEGDAMRGMALADGRTVPLEALYVAPRTSLNSELAQQLGCAIDDGMTGPLIRTDAMKATTVPGVFAAGDITRSAHNVTWACSDGVMAGTAAHRSLVFGL